MAGQLVSIRTAVNLELSCSLCFAVGAVVAAAHALMFPLVLFIAVVAIRLAALCRILYRLFSPLMSMIQHPKRVEMGSAVSCCAKHSALGE